MLTPTFIVSLHIVVFQSTAANTNAGEISEGVVVGLIFIELHKMRRNACSLINSAAAKSLVTVLRSWDPELDK